MLPIPAAICLPRSLLEMHHLGPYLCPTRRRIEAIGGFPHLCVNKPQGMRYFMCLRSIMVKKQRHGNHDFRWLGFHSQSSKIHFHQVFPGLYFHCWITCLSPLLPRLQECCVTDGSSIYDSAPMSLSQDAFSWFTLLTPTLVYFSL